MKDLFRIVSRRFMKDKKKAVSTLAIIITFVMVYTLIMPAVALERKAAENEPGIALEETVSGDAMAEAEPESLEAEAASAEESDAEAVSEAEAAAEEIAAESVVPAAEPAAVNSAVNDSSAAVQGTDAVSGQSFSRDTEVTNEVDGNQSAAEGSADPSVSDADETDAEEGMPAQNFEQTIKFNEIIDEEGNTVEKQVKVKVDADKNAFLAGAVMKAEVVLTNIDPQRLQDMEDAIEAAVKKEAEKSGLNADDTRIVQYQAIDISFLNKEGEKIEPAKKVEVRITSDKIREIENPVLVHVNENANTGVIKDADVIEKKDIAIIDEQPDNIDNNENTMLFKTSRFSPFVIVESEIVDENGGIINGLEGEYSSEAGIGLEDENSETGNNVATDGSGVLMAEGSDYNVTVTYDAKANIPENAELDIKEIKEASRTYQNYMEEAKDALEDDSSSINYAKIIDVDIVSDGEVVTPEAEVDVDIAYKNSDEIEEGTVVQALQFGEGTPAINDDAFVYGDETHIDGVQMKAVEIPVTAIVGTETLETTYLTADGKTLKVTVTFDENEQIPTGAELEVREIQEDDEKWIERSVRLADVLSENYGNVTLSDVRFLSISIMVDGEEYEPKAPVQVKIEYDEPLCTEDTIEPSYDELFGEEIVPKERENRFVTIHYTDDRVELIESNNITSEEGIVETICDFDSFSDADLVYMYDYDTYEAGDDYTPSSIHTVESVQAILTDTKTADEPMRGEVLRGAGDTPEHSKSLLDNQNGTYTIGLSVTGDADTDSTNASNVNVVMIYDVSTSMTNNYVPMATGGRGLDTSTAVSYRDGTYFPLYRLSGNTYYRLTDSENYTGTVYRLRRNNQDVNQASIGANTFGLNATVYPADSQRYSYDIQRADAGEKVLYDFVDALFGYQNADDPTNIQASVVTFAGSASTFQTWTSSEQDIVGTQNNQRMSWTGAANSRRMTYQNYTNWQAALQEAQSLLNNAPDEDPTYVVFITDGRPQISGNDDAYTNYRNAADEAAAIENYCDSTGGAMYGIYAYGKEQDWLASLMYSAYNNEARPSSDLEGETFDTEGYYKATDSEALTQAINEIFQRIVQTLGVTNVTIADGTTSSVQTSTGVAHLLDVDTSSYQYWLTIPNLTASGGTYTFSMINLKTGDPVIYTVTASGGNVTISWTDPEDNSSKSATYPGQINAGNTLTIEWTQATSFYNYAPPAASFTNGSVDWNLHPVGTLLDGVQYTVTFDCYPSQETLDLIADLKNGDVEYDSLDSAIKQYLDEDYDLKTNTTATLSYTDTRPGGTSGTIEYENPDPQPVNATEEIAVSKIWNNTLDNREGWKHDLTLYVTRDGEIVHDVDLNSDNVWTSTAWLSYGILTEDAGGVHLKTTGHHYSFAEDVETGYYWVIKAPTVRPMLVNNEVKLLKLLKEGTDTIPTEITGASGDNAKAVVGDDTYYKLTVDGDVYYYVVIPDMSSALTATNHRRSYLDVVKNITGSNAPEGDKFPFTMTVVNSNSDNSDPNDPHSDAWVWFSIWDTEASAMLTDPDAATASGLRWQLNDDPDNGTVVDSKPAASDFNGYFCVPSGTQITVGMQSNYSLRFLNLPDGSTYAISESETMPKDGYSFVSIAGERGYDADGKEETTDDWTTESAGTPSGQSITGTIEHVESAYKVTVTNKWNTIDVKLKKVDESGTTLDGSTFTLTSGETTIGTYSPNSTDAEVGNPVDLGGLGLGTYKLEETVVPTNYTGAEDVYFQVYKDTDGSLKARLVDASGTALSDQSAITSETGTDGLIYTITVENTLKTATVKVTKNVVGLEGDQSKEFAFTTTGVAAAAQTANLVGDTTAENHSVIYENVPYGTSVTVTETPDGSFAATYSVNGAQAVTGTSATFTVDDTTVTDGVAEVVFTNTRSKQLIKVYKYETGNENKALEGAVFTLTGPDGSDISYTGLETNADGYLENDGSVYIELPVNTSNYTLTETKAPDGYNMMTENVVFTVTTRGVTGTGSGYSVTSAIETVDGVSVMVYTIKVQNSAGVELPMTGGSGTLPYTLGGLMLVIASALMYGFRLRRRERRLN